MLSRYRSASGVALPRGSRAAAFNNPVQQFEEARGFRLECLQERAGGLAPGSLRTVLRLWDGPLAGVAHVAGQFPALEEGPAAEAAQPPPAELAQALASDLDLLMALAETAQDVLYDAGGSESDFAVVPIILEPRLPPTHGTASAGAAAAAAPSATAGTQTSGSETLESQEDGAGVSGVSGGGGGGWWPLREAATTPLTWEEAAASLGVAPALAAQMQPSLEFASEDTFWSHMLERHIRKLAGGEGLDLQQAGPAAAAPGAGAAAGPAAAAASASAAGSTTIQGSDPRVAAPGSEPLAAATSAAAMAAAVRQLVGAVSYPVFQAMLGSEALGWNPIPLLWLGRSRRSGAILGLLTAAVWT